jgi:FKBP-type peptidyl-prolyl cis-trans isomerase SlyD
MSDQAGFGSFDEMLNLEGNLIAFEFTMSDPKERVIDSNVGGEPMIFQSGTGEMLPALEEVLLKMAAGEKRRVVLSPSQAYGEVLPSEYRDFPEEMIPPEARQVGRKVMSRSPDGEERTLDVVAVENGKVTLDFNHPLAGMTLVFDVKVISNDPLR